MSSAHAVRSRSKFAPSILVVLAIIATLSSSLATPAPSAEALGCVLGPSLASAAKAVGVSCPIVEGEGGEPAWGAAGKRCTYGWNAENLPPRILEYLDRSTVTRTLYGAVAPWDHSKASVTNYYRDGKRIGMIWVTSEVDQFAMTIQLYGRDGLATESIFFDCMDSPIVSYSAFPTATPKAVTDPSTPAVHPANSQVATRASMSQLGLSNYLIRVDLTNTSATKPTFAEVHLGLAGYAVDGFPTLPREVRCQPAEGLECGIADLQPGQTTTIVILAHVDGSDEAAEAIDIITSGMGTVVVDLPDRAPARKRMATADMYVLARP